MSYMSSAACIERQMQALHECFFFPLLFLSCLSASASSLAMLISAANYPKTPGHKPDHVSKLHSPLSRSYQPGPNGPTNLLLVRRGPYRWMRGDKPIAPPFGLTRSLFFYRQKMPLHELPLCPPTINQSSHHHPSSQVNRPSSLSWGGATDAIGVS
ncbi:hypothetical protein V8C35DRAFT_204963 [Trichoderma chlorosporum]